jgi:hypothetical protein
MKLASALLLLLMKKHPNLYADLSIRALYRARDSREASIFHGSTTVKPEWIETIEKYPDRFMAGLDEYSQGYRNHEEYFMWMAKLFDQLTPSTARKERGRISSVYWTVTNACRGRRPSRSSSAGGSTSASLPPFRLRG